MAINSNPLFSGIPRSRGVSIDNTVTANTRSDGNGTIGTNMFKILTADSVYGSFVSSLRFSPWATAAATATTSTVIRIYLSTQSSGATSSANTFLIAELAAASQTADSSTAATFVLEYMLNRAIDPGYTLLFSIHAVPAANTGWSAVAFFGDFVNNP